MTEQEKKILFQAICESLPYGLRCTTKAHGWPGVYPICGCIGNKIILDCPKEVEGDDIWLVQNIVPYLRPLSDMTEEERNEYLSIKMQETERVALAEIYRPEAISEIMVWLISKHFDYRGLIPMGLALPAPEGMYK